MPVGINAYELASGEEGSLIPAATWLALRSFTALSSVMQMSEARPLLADIAHNSYSLSGTRYSEGLNMPKVLSQNGYGA